MSVNAVNSSVSNAHSMKSSSVVDASLNDVASRLSQLMMGYNAYVSQYSKMGESRQVCLNEIREVESKRLSVYNLDRSVLSETEGLSADQKKCLEILKTSNSDLLKLRRIYREKHQETTESYVRFTHGLAALNDGNQESSVADLKTQGESLVKFFTAHEDALSKIKNRVRAAPNEIRNESAGV